MNLLTQASQTDYWPIIIPIVLTFATTFVLAAFKNFLSSRNARQAQVLEANKARIEAEGKREADVLDEAADIRKELRGDVRDLRAEMAAVSKENADQRARIAFLEAQNVTFVQRITALSLEREHEHDRLKQEETARRELEGELTRAKQRIAELERQIALLQAAQDINAS